MLEADRIHIIKHEEREADDSDKDIHVCKKFGCNIHLSLSESLASDYCLNHNHEKQLINKQNIYQ